MHTNLTLSGEALSSAPLSFELVGICFVVDRKQDIRDAIKTENLHRCYSDRAHAANEPLPGFYPSLFLSLFVYIPIELLWTVVLLFLYFFKVQTRYP